jgi:hypothetical protein
LRAKIKQAGSFFYVNIDESAFHPRSTGVPQKGQSETMTDKKRNEERNKKTFKNNS